MLSGYQQAPLLADAVRKIALGADPAPNDPQTDQFLPVISEMFRCGVAQSIILNYGDELFLDVHAPSDAKDQKKKYSSVVDRIVKLLRHLKNSPYDSGRSMLDVTTILVSSEFSRTMRQLNMPIDGTGTDHNALCNSVWLFGKGIRGGQIIGASDYQTSDETLSGAHQQFDTKGIKFMGKPFDFSAMRPRTDLPAAFDVRDYLTFNSVANTIYDLFQVPKEQYRTLGRDLPIAPSLKGLI
jgi:hypothetical protein